jgi:hypothetical protein
MDDRIHEPAIDIEAIRWERMNGASDRVIDELILGQAG